jgi:hypothetical protein
MATGILQTGAPFRTGAQERFFEAYQWCLNPMLSLRDLVAHLGQEIESYTANGAAGWQGEERRINLYLFSCAIACTLDDHLAARPWNLAAVERRLPRARLAIRAAEAALNAPHAWRSHAAAASAAGWRRQWTDCVDAACELLLGGDSRFCEQARQLLAAAPSALDEATQRRRVRIPEAFRCQDLTHQDVCAMVRLCLPALPEKDRPIAIVGPRTAGAYFAPLAAAQLHALGYTRVTWLTVRPKNGLSRAESHAISTAVGTRARLLGYRRSSEFGPHIATAVGRTAPLGRRIGRRRRRASRSPFHSRLRGGR